MPANYRVAPIFLIRLAGVPFDRLERLATPEVATAAREILRQEPARAADEGCTESMALQSARIDLEPLIEHYLLRARTSLHEEAEAILPAYLVFGSGDSRHMLKGRTAKLPIRNSKERGRERTLLLYLQRIAAKNETFSAFGPTSWGRADPRQPGLRFSVTGGIAERLVFFERWVAQALADAISADQEVSADLRSEATALTPFAFDLLRDEVARWPTVPARERWAAVLDELSKFAESFATNIAPAARVEAIDSAKALLAVLGFERTKHRSLYVATNPITEECARQAEFVIGQDLMDEVARDAKPWIDLWRDTYAFVASRVSATLSTVLRKVGGGSSLSLPAFLHACAKANLPLETHGLIAPAAIAFQEVKVAFRQRLDPHSQQEEYELTEEDCRVVRDSFDFELFDEFTFPSADLQLAAESVVAVNRGEYRWILSELHPPVAMLQHCMWWGCPDKAALSGYLREIAGDSFHFGFVPSDFTAHTTIRIFDALPDKTTFVAPQRPDPRWKQFPTSEAEVYVAENGDVRVRRAGTKEDVGSFARSWLIPLGFHPFQFGLAPHTPRLRCGNVVVQRRTWTVTASELPLQQSFRTSDLLLGVERLRGNRGLPRHVYIRPTEQALRRAGAENRDKDTKPVFIDLESILSLEILQRWLAKAGEVEVTEMLPSADELLWQEEDGRRTFELRTLIIPRS